MTPAPTSFAPRPTRRNPWATWLFPLAVMALAPPLGAVFGTTAFRLAPVAALNLGVLLTLLSIVVMLRELASVSQGEPVVWWHALIPIYNVYWAAVIVRGRVAATKARHGKSSPRGAVAYALALPYALAADLNDLVGVSATSQET
jgi:hypothetical protein